MNYHETVPTTPGVYRSFSQRYYRSPFELTRYGKWWDVDSDCKMQVHCIKDILPLLGPFPNETETAISLACEVAFARMVVAGASIPKAWSESSAAYRGACNRHISGERTLSLLREMERVTSELTKTT